MRVVSVIGISGSGKTTTVEQLLRNLKKALFGGFGQGHPL